MDRLHAMAAFVAVADQRSFAAAGRRLALSPPAMTRLVAGLEARLGVRLLHRTTRSVALTEAGARFLERARRVLVDVEEAERSAQAGRAAPAGRLVLSAPRFFGRLHVAPLLSAFLARNPAVTGELVLADRVVNLVEEGVDVAVRIGHLADSTLVARPVGRVRRVIVASPTYLRRHGTPARPEDLANHEVVQLTAMSPSQEWRLLRDGREVRVPFAPRLVTDDADVAVGHAVRGGGLALALSYQVAAEVRAGRLRVLLPGSEPPPLPVQLVYPTSRFLPAKVRAFADEVLRTARWDFTDLGASPAGRRASR